MTTLPTMRKLMFGVVGAVRVVAVVAVAGVVSVVGVVGVVSVVGVIYVVAVVAVVGVKITRDELPSYGIGCVWGMPSLSPLSSIDFYCNYI